MLQGTSGLDPTLQPTKAIRTIKTVLPPLSKLEVGTIRCIGLNYRWDAVEMKFDLPTYPSVSFRPSTCLNSSNAPLAIPHHATDQQADYEAELAVVIDRECRNVDKENAMSFVLGYMSSNDVTARKWQFVGGTTRVGYGEGLMVSHQWGHVSCRLVQYLVPR